MEDLRRSAKARPGTPASTLRCAHRNRRPRDVVRDRSSPAAGAGHAARKAAPGVLPPWPRSHRHAGCGRAVPSRSRRPSAPSWRAPARSRRTHGATAVTPNVPGCPPAVQGAGSVRTAAPAPLMPPPACLRQVPGWDKDFCPIPRATAAGPGASDSRTVKTIEAGGPAATKAKRRSRAWPGTRARGRRRHGVVDATGMRDGDGVPAVPKSIRQAWPRLRRPFADGAPVVPKLRGTPVRDRNVGAGLRHACRRRERLRRPSRTAGRGTHPRMARPLPPPGERPERVHRVRRSGILDRQRRPEARPREPPPRGDGAGARTSGSDAPEARRNGMCACARSKGGGGTPLPRQTSVARRPGSVGPALRIPP